MWESTTATAARTIEACRSTGDYVGTSAYDSGEDAETFCARRLRLPRLRAGRTRHIVEAMLRDAWVRRNWSVDARTTAILQLG